MGDFRRRGEWGEALECSQHCLGLSQWARAPHPTALDVGPDPTLSPTHLDSGAPSPVGRCTSCQALGGGGCHFWSSARGTANKDAIIRGGGGTSPFAQLCEQTGETIFIPLCC